MEENDTSEKRIKEILAQAAKTEIEKKERAYKEKKGLLISQSLKKISPKQESKKKRSLGRAKITLQKKPLLEQMHCSQNQKYPLFFIENLQTRKVQNLTLKEHFIAARNLKLLSFQMQNWMHKKVKILGKETQEFYDLMQKREERHFQIDRIIRYLSEP